MKFAAKSGGVNLALLIVVYFIGVIVGGIGVKDSESGNVLPYRGLVLLLEFFKFLVYDKEQFSIPKFLSLVVAVLVLLAILYVGLSFLASVMEGIEKDEEN